MSSNLKTIDHKSLKLLIFWRHAYCMLLKFVIFFNFQPWNWFCKSLTRCEWVQDLFFAQMIQGCNPFKPNGISHSSIGPVYFCFKGCWVVFFIFLKKIIRIFCKQTVETLIRCHILCHLIWVCTVCLCPAKRTPAVYGLMIYVHLVFHVFLTLKAPPIICSRRQFQILPLFQK